MRWTSCHKCCVLMAGLMVLGSLAIGCGSDKRDREVRHHRPRVSRTERHPHNALAPVDRSRAERAIERNQREMGGRRRPHQPPSRRPIDQPPRSSRR